MSKVIIASLNPAKIQAVEQAFGQAFPTKSFDFEGVDVASEVSAQPMSDQETLLGARNRVRNAKIAVADADFYVGLEAGIEGTETYAWMVIESATQRGESRSSSLPLPPKVLALLAQGIELGDVMDQLFSVHNIKQKGGAIGLLTNNVLTRSSVYQQALLLALIPFINPQWYPDQLSAQ